MKARTRWLPDEDSIIRNKALTTLQLAELLPRRTPKAIRNRRVAINGRIRRRWTPEDDALLRQHYPDLTTFAERMPYRTPVAISVRAQKLDLCTQDRVWTCSDVMLVTSMQTARAARELASKLNRTPVAIGKIRSKFRASSTEPRFKAASVPLLNDVRQIALEAKLNLRSAERMAGVHDGLLKRRHTPPGYAGLFRVAKCLGAELYAEWED